jgi:hypothetical protein
VGRVAAGLGEGGEVLVPADECPSALYTVLVARERSVRVGAVPYDGGRGAIRPGTTLVVTSRPVACQSASSRTRLSAGRVALERARPASV